MKKLRLFNGKFFRGDEEVPIEIGNKEQIECYKKSIAKMEEFSNGIGVDYTYDITFDAYIDCICGHTISISDTVECFYLNKGYGTIEDNIEDELLKSHRSFSCPKCGREYYFERTDDGELKYYSSAKCNMKYDNLSDEILQGNK